MPRYGRYLRLEKNIAASDTGGILERWRYGRRLLSDGKATTPVGNLRHGVLAALIADAQADGYKLTEQEIQRRLRAARTYPTEAEIRELTHGFQNWDEAARAGFPPVEVTDPGDPYDPRDADEKWRDFRSEQERRKAENPQQLAFELPQIFSHDTFGPRTQLADMVAACDVSEQMTANFVKYDAQRRAYVDELLDAAGGNDRMTWIEAEARRRGLDAIGVSDWESFDEIMNDWLGRRDDAPTDEADDDEP
jgi:hypothetical protein